MPRVGQRLSYDGALCTVRYIGDVKGTNGQWLGVEWDDPARGKHDGMYKGERYFTCKSKSSLAASFIRPARKTDGAVSFVQALHQKYASDTTAIKGPGAFEIEISGKIVEEVGFEKIRQTLARLEDLKIVILDGMCIVEPVAEGDRPIKEVSPKIVELDLSRNLFETIEPIVEICGELVFLQSLRISGNRFQRALEIPHSDVAKKSFAGITDLSLDEMMLSWEELWHIASQFDSLSDLKANANQLTTLPTMPAAGMQETLTTLHLEYNDIASLSAIASLRQLKALRNLHLKGNNISAIADKPDSSTPVFSSTIHYVDLSYNQIPSWSFIDALPVCFPGLTSLRLSNNPIYDDPDLDGWSAGTSENISSGPSRGVKNNPTEEAHMLAVARLGSLRSLNFSRVGAQDRADAETYYLSRIARQLAAVPLGSPEEAAVKARHPRYDELCQIHGEPDIVRHDGKAEANPAALEARLVDVTFAFDKSEFVGPPITVLGGKGKKRAVMQQKARIPKSFDMYGLRSIAARVVSGATGVPVAPLSLKLVWETGEWDPVAGLRDGEEDEDREDPEEEQRHDEGGHDWMEEDDEEAEAERARMSRWVRREEELKDGPRRLGFSIDGMEARIRVELAGAVR